MAAQRAGAAQGARVVVNDLGGAIDGSGSDAGPALEVVDEIFGKDSKEGRKAKKFLDQLFR